MVPAAERGGVVESSDNTSSKADSDMSAASARRAAVCISASLAGNRMEKLSHRLHPPKQRKWLTLYPESIHQRKNSPVLLP